MADDYGIGSTAVVALRLYDMQSRRSGRTTRMLERVKSGDTIVVSSPEQIRAIERVMREAEIENVRIIAINPRDSLDAIEHRLRNVTAGRSGRVLLDHTVVLNFYMDAIGNVEQFIDALVERNSRRPNDATPQPIDIHRRTLVGDFKTE